MLATGDGRAQGFTLIEALAVVAITALVSSIAFPRLQSAIGAQEFRAARGTVELGLGETRAAAIRSGEPVRFLITRDGSSFTVQDRPERRLPDAVRLRQKSEIIFFADGTSTGGLVTLSGKDQQASFAIFPTTGLISVSQ